MIVGAAAAACSRTTQAFTKLPSHLILTSWWFREMRSIVVIGDVRVHLLSGPENLRTQSKYYGGVMLMQASILQALQRSHGLSLPQILSYANTELKFHERPKSTQRGVKRWRVEERKIEVTGRTRYCLAESKAAGLVHRPLLGDSLQDCLSSHRYPGDMSYPDILVLDDLNLHTRDVRFAKPVKRPENVDDEFERLKDRKSDAEAKMKQIAQALKTATEFERKRLEDELWLAHRDVVSTEEDYLQFSLKVLLWQLAGAARECEEKGDRFPAEPVLILSSTGKLPDLIPNGETKKDRSKKTIWQHVYANEALRRRSIVMLDVTSLREDISISSGLSWERTVQDTIIELRRHRDHRNFLKFGFVVVRFGLTAALLISNEQNGDSSFTLFFSPEHDDTSFTHLEDGEVLGATAVMVASIVEQLSLRCSWRKGRAVYQDIGPTLDRALMLAVSRMSKHFELGYGQDEAEFERGIHAFPSDAFDDRSDIIQRQVFDESHQFQNLAVQKVQLAPFRSRHWSILGQSCQVDLNDVADNIVMAGPKVAINTMEHPIDDFVRCWIRRTVTKMQESDPKYTLYQPNTHARKVSLAYQLVESLHSMAKEEDYATRRLIGESLHRRLRELVNSLREVPVQKKLLEKLANAKMHREAKRLETTVSDLKKKVDGEASNLVSKLQEVFSRKLSDRAFRAKASELIDRADDLGLSKKARKKLSRLEEADYIVPEAFLGRQLKKLILEKEPTHGWTSSVSSPVLRLGTPPESGKRDKRLLVIDRKEVESIRAVKRMIEQYLISTVTSQPERPLSIAVFGPPGAGKSVAVNKIVSMMESTGVKTETKTINLSQLKDIDDLNSHMNEVVKINAARKVPIVFFDEFDSALGERRLGWLKYFLSMMEDGDKVKTAVFVFAGGTSDSFEAFSLANRSRSDQEWITFAESKGPDFTSRLSGHVNVIGINPTSPDDDLYIIRRALTLRFLLCENQNLKESDTAKIDRNMLNAFLHVPRYIHGSRSMRKLVELCMSRDQKQVSMSEVPPIHQLDMQVDGKAFSALASGQTKPVLINEP